MKFLCETVQKLKPEQADRWTDGQTDGQTDTTEIITYPHSQVVKLNEYTFYTQHASSFKMEGGAVIFIFFIRYRSISKKSI